MFAATAYVTLMLRNALKVNSSAKKTTDGQLTDYLTKNVRNQPSVNYWN